MEVGASIVSLLSVGATITIAINDLVTSCKNAPLFAQSILHETLEFSYALSKLQRLVQGPQASSLDQSRTSMIDVNHLSLTLVGCVCTFSQLEKEIQRMKLSGKFGIMDRVKWSFIERDVASIVQRIQNHKMSLVLILTILNGSPTEATNSRASLDTHLSTTMSNTPSSILDDDGAASVTSNSSTAGKLYRRSFESALFVSRPYVRGKRFEDAQSALSIATSQRPKGWWSLYTAKSNHSVFSLPVSVTTISGTSLADIPSICNLSLPVPPGVLDNSGVYDLHRTNPSKPTYTSSSRPIGLDRLSPMVEGNYHSGLLLEAAAKGLDVVVTSLLDQAAVMSIEYIQKMQPHLDDALSEAVVNGQTQVMFILLERGARWSSRAVDALIESSLLEPLRGRRASPVIEVQDPSVSTALNVAINNDARRDVIAFPLNGDKATQGVDRDGFTLLHMAVLYMRSESSIEHLLDQGAAVEARTRDGYNALHLAVKTPYPIPKTIKLLLARGADIEAETDTHNTPLHLAMMSTNIEIMGLLLDEGAAIEARGTGGYTTLHQAVSCGRAVVKFLLDRGADIEAETDTHDTPLHLAMRANDIEMVKLLLDQGAAIEARDIFGYIPLHQAVSCGREVVKFLLDRGADIEAETNKHDKPLHLAVTVVNNTEVVKLLLDQGAAIEARDIFGYTPLHLASSYGREVVKFLLDRGADIEAETDKHDKPLHLAVKARSIQIVELLLDQGAAIEARGTGGYTPLHLAISYGREVVKFLLDRGADIEAETNSHDKPLHLAMRARSILIVELLLDQGAAIEARGTDGYTPLHQAVSCGREVVKFLLDRGAAIEARGTGGYTPLHLAISYGREVVKFLLDRGADIEAETNSHDKPLHLAMRARSILIVGLLLDQGAAIEARGTGGYTPLHQAVSCGTVIVKLLLDRGADIEAETDTYDKPLHLAVKARSIQIVELLLDQGAAIDARGTGGYTPLHLAISYGREVVKFLLDRGADIEAETDTHDRALHLAEMSSDTLITALLLGEGATIVTRRASGSIPL